MSARQRQAVSTLVLILVVTAGWGGSIFAQSFNKILDLPAIVGGDVQGSLVQATDGALIGTSLTGGVNGRGVVFKVNRYGNVVILHAFIGTDGASPNAPLVPDAAGDLWGTTRHGGVFNAGVIFKISLDGGYVVLHNFNNMANPRHGANPWAGLVKASDGNFFGATGIGGFYGHGTIFEITQNGIFSVLRAINDNVREGRSPLGRLVEARDGRLWGTCSSGGAFQTGTIVSVDRSNGALTVEHTFAGWDGSKYPEGRNVRAALVEATDGKLWSATVQGGRSDGGTFFTYDPLPRAFRTIYQIAEWDGRRYPDGFFPAGGLIQVGDGFWGVAGGGGEHVGGTVFRLNASGAFEVIHAFNSKLGDGVSPIGELMHATDGSIFGVTRLGWQGGNGTLFVVYP